MKVIIKYINLFILVPLHPVQVLFQNCLKMVTLFLLQDITATQAELKTESIKNVNECILLILIQLCWKINKSMILACHGLKGHVFLQYHFQQIQLCTYWKFPLISTNAEGNQVTILLCHRDQSYNSAWLGLAYAPHPEYHHFKHQHAPISNKDIVHKTSNNCRRLSWYFYIGNTF